MRCQARFDFIDEIRFRSLEKGNVKQQKMNTTMCNIKSNPIFSELIRLGGRGL